jgi:hypothetical protein
MFVDGSIVVIDLRDDGEEDDDDSEDSDMGDA